MSSTRADRGRSGSLARLRLCMVMHVARVERLARGRARGTAGQDWGIDPPRSTGVRNGSVSAKAMLQPRASAASRWGIFVGWSVVGRVLSQWSSWSAGTGREM
jgi:hypothetical protein